MKSNKDKELKPATHTTFEGTFKYQVFNEDGTTQGPEREQKNLILDEGMENLGAYLSYTNWSYCWAGTGNSANSVDFSASTFDQTGTTVTRASGTDIFTGGMIGDTIGFENGKQGKIISVDTGTSITVSTSQTVTGETAKIYDTDRLVLDNKIAFTNTRLNDVRKTVWDTAPVLTPSHTFYESYLFASGDVENNTITELATARGTTNDIFARILLDDPVPLGPGQTLGVTYIVKATYDYSIKSNVDPQITGWPVEYPITSIVDQTGDLALVTMAPDPGDDHHYQVGGNIIIENARRPEIALSSMSSTATEFTGTTSATHNLSVGASIVIEGVTPSAYNGTWTIDATPTATTFEVLSAVNPGAGTGGSVREADPGTWWNGEHAVTAVGVNTVTISVTSGIPDAGAGGVVTNSGLCETICKSVFATYPPNEDPNGDPVSVEIGSSGGLEPSSTAVFAALVSTGPGTNYGIMLESSDIGGRFGTNEVLTTESYDPATFTRTKTVDCGVLDWNKDDIKQIWLAPAYSGAIPNKKHMYSMYFYEPQKKLDTHTLQIRFRWSWGRILAD